MNTPNLDALLEGVDRSAGAMDDPALYALDAAARIRSMDSRHASVAPRLAAMLRVAVEALSILACPDSLLEANEDAFSAHAARHMKAQATAALARIETLAGGGE